MPFPNLSQNILNRLIDIIRRQTLFVGAIVSALVLTVLWCLSVPDIYVSQVKVSDEAKEMDLNIGLDFMTVTMRDLNPSSGNESQNDVNIYSRILGSMEFADSLAHTQLPGKDKTFFAYCIEDRKTSLWQKISVYADKLLGDYSDDDYVAGIVNENLKSNLRAKYKTLTIQYEDPDPLVAALMVDSAAKLLQQRIDKYRQGIQQAGMKDALVASQQAHQVYVDAQMKYDRFVDDHADIMSMEDRTIAESLDKVKREAFDSYTKQHEKYVRAYALSKKDVSSFAILRNATVAQSPSSPVPFPIFLAFLSILLFFVYLIHRIKEVRNNGMLKMEWGGVFSPWSIMLFHWIAILLMFSVESELLEPLSTQFYYSLLLWVSIFVACSFGIYQFLPRKNVSFDLRKMEVNVFIFNLFFWLSVIITPLHLYQIMKLVMMFDPTDMLSNIRILAVSEEGGAGLLNYSYVINQVLLVVAMCRYPNISKWKLTIIVLCTLISAFAVMEKGILLYLVVVVLFACYEKRYIKMHTIITILCLIVGVFFFLTLARFSDDSDASKTFTFVDFFAIYILSGPVAFGRLVEDLTMQFGANTFQTAYLFLNRMFPGQYEVHQALQEFVWIPLPTNVYTVMQPFYIDFGYTGVAYFAFIYGTASAVLYRMYRNGSAFGFCMYAYIAEVLMIQFHQDEIFFGMVHFIQFTFFVWLFTYDGIKLNISRKHYNP